MRLKLTFGIGVVGFSGLYFWLGFGKALSCCSVSGTQ